MQAELLQSTRERPGDSWEMDGHASENVNDRVDQVDNGISYWGDQDDTVTVGDNVNINQAGNDSTTWGGNGIPSFSDYSDSNSDEGWDMEPTPGSEVDTNCEDDSSNTESIPDSSVDGIVSAINRNTDVVSDLCEIMEGLREGLERLHEDNVQSNKVLQKLLTEQRTLGDKLS